ncbi:hypothetical protein LTR54_017334 [Friedmanniomyces endolithicus]|nr:hypothetical protein LTR54_017334 [Friedmanniomyces endolithicus]
MSSGQIAGLLNPYDNRAVTQERIDNIGKAVKLMEDNGSRFLNLESSVNKGITLVLGKEMSRTQYMDTDPPKVRRQA